MPGSLVGGSTGFTLMPGVYGLSYCKLCIDAFMSDNLHAVMLMSCQLSIVPADSGWPVECKECFTE